MANYDNLIDQPNPFFTHMPVVVACRNVRIIAVTEEEVREDGNALPRQLHRIVDELRTYPRRVSVTVERNFPANRQRKGEW